MPEEWIFSGYCVNQHVREMIDRAVINAVKFAAQQGRVVSGPVIMRENGAQGCQIPMAEQGVVQHYTMVIINEAAIKCVCKRENHQKTKKQEMESGRR